MESIATPDNAHGKETYCHCEDESIGRYVAFGSTTDSGGYPQFRPLLGAERTSNSGRFRSACSHNRTLTLLVLAPRIFVLAIQSAAFRSCAWGAV